MLCSLIYYDLLICQPGPAFFYTIFFVFIYYGAYMAIPTQTECEQVAQILKTLSHPQRLMILCQLAGEPKNVTELEQLSGATQSAVSQFLARMKAEGLVTSHRDARSVFYEIADPRIKKLVQSMHRIFCA